MKRLSVLLILVLSLVFTSCGGSSVDGDLGESEMEDKKKVVIGGTAASFDYTEILMEKYREMGYEPEFKMMDSNIIPLEAVQSGDIDVSIAQHKPYMEMFNENNNADLMMAKPYGMYTGIGLYSKKHDSIEDFPDGAQISVMNDAMNENIALRILESEGLIKIDPDTELATVADIIENPKNLDIIEVEQGQSVVTLDDMDGACVFFTLMANAGLDASNYLARDNEMINFPMGPIVKSENSEAKWATDLASCYRDPEVQEKIQEKIPNVFVFYESDSQVSE